MAFLWVSAFLSFAVLALINPNPNLFFYIFCNMKLRLMPILAVKNVMVINSTIFKEKS
jgi:hypothetical protein